MPEQPNSPTPATIPAQHIGTDSTGPVGAAPAPDGAAHPVRFRVELPPGLELPNANQRLHHLQKARLVRALRNAAHLAARAAGVPALQCAHVFYTVHPDTPRRRRDPGNWAPAAKAAIDGLIDAGLLPDDNSTRLLGPDPRLGHPVRGTQLVLTITDLTRVPAPYLVAFDPTRQLQPTGEHQ